MYNLERFHHSLFNNSIISTPKGVKTVAFSSAQTLLLRPVGSLCLVVGGYKLVTTYPTKILKTCHCDAFQQQPIVLKVPLAKPITEKQEVSLARDIWKLIKPDLLLMGCIILTAIAAAFVHLQTPIITGELINVISSGSSALLASAGISQLNRPAMKLFALLSVQGNKAKLADLRYH